MRTVRRLTAREGISRRGHGQTKLKQPFEREGKGWQDIQGMGMKCACRRVVIRSDADCTGEEAVTGALQYIRRETEHRC